MNKHSYHQILLPWHLCVSTTLSTVYLQHLEDVELKKKGEMSHVISQASLEMGHVMLPKKMAKGLPSIRVRLE